MAAEVPGVMPHPGEPGAVALPAVRNFLRNLEFFFVFENLARVAAPRRWAAPLT